MCFPGFISLHWLIIVILNMHGWIVQYKAYWGFEVRNWSSKSQYLLDKSYYLLGKCLYKFCISKKPDNLVEFCNTKFSDQIETKLHLLYLSFPLIFWFIGPLMLTDTQQIFQNLFVFPSKKYCPREFCPFLTQKNNKKATQLLSRTI